MLISSAAQMAHRDAQTLSGNSGDKERDAARAAVALTRGRGGGGGGARKNAKSSSSPAAHAAAMAYVSRQAQAQAAAHQRRSISMEDNVGREVQNAFALAQSDDLTGSEGSCSSCGNSAGVSPRGPPPKSESSHAWTKPGTTGGHRSEGTVESPLKKNVQIDHNIDMMNQTTTGHHSTYTIKTIRRSHLEGRRTWLPRSLQQFRISIYLMLDQPSSSRAARSLSIFFLVCIVTSIIGFVLETMPELEGHISDDAWLILEAVCTVIFTVEYVLRLSVCTVTGQTIPKFIMSASNIIDAAAILPFYIWLAMRNVKMVRVLGILRTIRLVRIFRIFKLGRYSTGLQLMVRATRNSSHAALALAFFLTMGAVLFASLIFYVEKVTCPERTDLSNYPSDDGSNRTQLEHYLEQCHLTRTSSYGLCCDENESPLDFPDIVQTLWWAAVTMTTVGFGDTFPRTRVGRCIGGLSMLSGVLLIALPVAMIGRKFQEVYLQHLRSIGKDPCANCYRTPQQVKELQEMARWMRTLQSRSELGETTHIMANEFEALAQLEQEIIFMQTTDLMKHRTVLKHFDVLLSKFVEITVPIQRSSLDGNVSPKKAWEHQRISMIG